VVICPHQALFLAPLPGKNQIFARGVSHAQSLLCFCFALLYVCLDRFIKNKKIASFIVVIFLLLVHYVVP
jgi:hypothetical protein